MSLRNKVYSTSLAIGLTATVASTVGILDTVYSIENSKRPIKPEEALKWDKRSGHSLKYTIYSLLTFGASAFVLGGVLAYDSWKNKSEGLQNIITIKPIIKPSIAY